MKNILLAIFCLLFLALLLPACKDKEVCLKCTIVVNTVEEVKPEMCDTDEAVLDQQQATYQSKVDEFAAMGWDAKMTCTRQ